MGSCNGLKIGRLSYINALPFYAGLSDEFEFVRGVPSELNQKLCNGELDISLISAYEFLSSPYQLVPGFCIAAREKVASVTLHTKVPPQELDGQEIALTRESASSAQLVKLLCSHFWGISPSFVPLDEPAKHPAFLIIGDDALRQPTFDGYSAMDLATAWNDRTGLPMTFAVFAARKDLDATVVQQFASQLDASLRWSEAHPDKIIEMAQKESELPTKTLQEYYPLLTYRMEQAQKEGLNLFEHLSNSHV